MAFLFMQALTLQFEEVLFLSVAKSVEIMYAYLRLNADLTAFLIMSYLMTQLRKL